MTVAPHSQKKKKKKKPKKYNKNEHQEINSCDEKLTGSNWKAL